jgi:hypothetical protein
MHEEEAVYPYGNEPLTYPTESVVTRAALQTFERVEEMRMDQIFNYILALINLTMVGIATAFAQRKWGSKRLFWVWLISAVIITGNTSLWVLYQNGFPDIRQAFLAVAVSVALLFIMAALASGLLIVCVATLVPPPEYTSTGVNYFPYNLPMGPLEDTYGLAGILRKYQELLSTFATALDSALSPAHHNPYQPILRDFLGSFRTYLPGYLRQARVSSRQFDRAPNALMRDLAGADVVLAELEKLTTAQLSAIEQCHLVNTRRVSRRRFTIGPISEWSEKGKLLATAATAVLGSLGVGKVSDLWPLIRGITFTEGILQSSIIIIFSIVVFPLMGLLISSMTFTPILRRLQAFEDILTIAKAYRKGINETLKPSPEL